VVEMAIVLPLLMILTLGLIEYGWLFLKEHEVTNVARQAARIAVLPYTSNDEVRAEIDPMMASAGLADSGYTVSFSPEDVSTPYPHDLVRVTITVPYRNVTLLNSGLVPTPENLVGSVAMAKEGP